MRCKKHSADRSSTVGVCASCLRERLFSVMAAQVCRQPKPLSFPRSVSPYVPRHHQQQSFYSTPLVGPTRSDKAKSRSRGGSKLSSLFLGLFRSKPDPDPGAPSESSSWFSAIIPGRRKKQNPGFWYDGGAAGARRKSGRNRDRGMSPARYSDDLSGYSSESSQGWRQTPRRTPATARRRGAGHSRNGPGLGFCLSPLVRPSPNWHWKGITPEMMVAGESRVPPSAHLSTSASLCKNRSRKLADFGRHSYKAGDR